VLAFRHFEIRRQESTSLLAFEMVQLLQRRALGGASQSLVEFQVDLKTPLPLESPSPSTSPLAVQVLRFHPEEKEAPTSLKTTRFVYELETCHQASGEVFRAERRFREFKRLREALLLNCRDCPDCRPFFERLQRSRLPSRQMVVLDINKYGTSRMLELTNFLRDLVHMVAQYAHYCVRDGPDIDKSVGLFLGLDSLSETLDQVASSTRAMQMPLKTRQDRIDFRAASMPEMRFSSSSVRLSNDALQQIRARGYSDVGHGRENKR
jgi:hypothetical protein